MTLSWRRCSWNRHHTAISTWVWVAARLERSLFCGSAFFGRVRTTTKFETLSGSHGDEIGCPARRQQPHTLGEIPEPSGPVVERAPAIELRGVDFGWSPEHHVLSGVNLAVQPGEHVALIGPSGGGKSTVLALIEGLADPDHGVILMDGRGLPASERREMCAIVRQSAFLFTGTLAENLRLAKPDATDEELLRALEAANLDEVRQWPRGLATQLGERGLEISGGQAQAHIARGLRNTRFCCSTNRPRI